MHLIIFGILLGMGAAIPIGPVNLEIIRRNIRFGTAYGMVTGLGACVADLTYLVLLCFGGLALLQHPTVLRMMGIVGSLILAWFAWQIFHMQAKDSASLERRSSLLKYAIEGYSMTMINPMTILFWGSVSAQISLTAIYHPHAMVLSGAGVLIGTIGWVLFLNSLIHYTRHKLSSNVIKWLNYAGGGILLSFAMAGLWRAFT